VESVPASDAVVPPSDVSLDDTPPPPHAASTKTMAKSNTLIGRLAGLVDFIFLSPP
jgi:hypothetical protein